MTDFKERAERIAGGAHYASCNTVLGTYNGKCNCLLTDNVASELEKVEREGYDRGVRESTEVAKRGCDCPENVEHGYCGAACNKNRCVVLIRSLLNKSKEE